MGTKKLDGWAAQRETAKTAGQPEKQQKRWTTGPQGEIEKSLILISKSNHFLYII